LVSKALKENKLDEIKKLYIQSSLNQLIIGGALFAFLWASIDAIYQIVPGAFSQGKMVVFYIGLSRLFILITGISGPIIVFSKYYRVNLLFNLFLVGLTIFSNYILINKFGMVGAAVATAITFLTYNILKVVYIEYRFKMQPFTIETIKSIIVLIITGLIGSYIEIFPQIPLLSIILKSIIIAILLIIGFYGLKVKAEVLDIPRNIFKR
jgi:O-antigen/teichoic acid export membrane protein